MKKNWLFFSNQKGSIILPVVVGAGVGLVALLGLSNLITSTANSARGYASEFEADVGATEIRESLKNPAICDSSITALGIDPTINNNIPVIRNGGTILYSPGDSIVSGINTISQLTQVAAPIGPNSVGLVTIRVVFDARGTTYGSDRKSRTFQIQVNTDGGGLITGCLARPYQAFDDCVHLITGPLGSGRTSYSPFCPAGYTLTGGGYEDGDISNDSFGNGPDWPLNRRWRCFSDDPDGTRYCAAICCR